MKKLIFSMIVALMATVVARAQQIAVVSDGTTTLYHTLQEAIEGAPAGSVIYLPGGGFPISDDVKITKKLTIIGIGHYAKSGNVDGVTTISGNLFFNAGSDGSAVMGCYISKNISIGEGETAVNKVLIKNCNISGINVNNNSCVGIVVNQNYVRGFADFKGCSDVIITNNIIMSPVNINGGVVSYNIITSCYNYAFFNYIYNSTVMGNIIIDDSYYSLLTDYDKPNTATENMSHNDYGGDNICISETDWKDVFVNFNDGSISPVSDFHFKDAHKQYENQVGIYAGSGFSDKGMAPVPYIVAKHVDEQTDASGMLKVNIRVSAGE